MKFNFRGEFVPALSGECTGCGLCLKVCPALELGTPLCPEELFGKARVGKNPHIGNFTASFVGYSDRHRLRAASGGMATWTLEALFGKGKIHAAVCVARSQKNDRFFEPVIVSSVSALLNCCGSKYYPVEFSTILAHILANEGRYAVVALPCVVSAIRKAQRAIPLLRERIPYLLALVCGHGVSKHFADFLLAVVGLDQRKARQIDFRYSSRSSTAANFALRAQQTDGRWSRPFFFSGLYGRLWSGRFFVPRACDFCDDLFSPLADASFMDAWLPEFAADPRGTSIVVARKPDLAELLRQAQQERDCRLRPIAIEDVQRSQAAALSYKTTLLPLRVARAERDGLKIPRSFKRIAAPLGMKQKLVGIRQAARDKLCECIFDKAGHARGFWVTVLTAFLRGQSIWRARRRLVSRIRQRITRLRSQPMAPRAAMPRKTKTHPHFLIVGHGGFWNRGCEAILDTTVRLLSEWFDKPTFTVVTFDWANDRRHGKNYEGVTFRSVSPERWRSRYWFVKSGRTLLRLPSGDWRASHTHLRREYQTADAVLSVGGDNYTTDYSPFPGYYLDVLKYAREQGTRGVIWAATVGPFDDPDVLRKVLSVLQNTPLITARESLTIQYLTSLGITNNVRAVADTGFLLEPLQSPAVLSYGIRPEKKWLGMSVSSMLGRYLPDERKSDLSGLLANFVDWAVAELGLSVVLIPHVVDTRPGAPLARNDFLFLGQIAERVGRRNRIVLVEPSLRAAEMKYLISCCRFFIGSRTHSTISALSSCVPTISLSYSMKSRGINQDVLGNQDFVFPVRELSVDTLTAKFHELTRREEEVRTALKARIPAVKEMARKNARYLGELLGVEPGEKWRARHGL